MAEAVSQPAPTRAAGSESGPESNPESDSGFGRRPPASSRLSPLPGPRPQVASFRGGDQLSEILARLRDHGVRREAISVLMSEAGSVPRFGLVARHKLAAGLALGAALGGLLGTILGLSVGLSAFVGPASLSPVLGALAGAGIGGATGSIVGALFGLAVREHRIKLNSRGASAGGGLWGGRRGEPGLIAVWVDSDEQAARVAQLL